MSSDRRQDGWDLREVPVERRDGWPDRRKEPCRHVWGPNYAGVSFCEKCGDNNL